MGSSLAGSQDKKQEQHHQVTEKDLKGKKVDADPTEESDRPSEQ